jgi:hypothetical protein
LDQFGIHAGVAVMALSLPAVIVLSTHALMRSFSQRLKSRSAIELAYGYLPLVLGGNLAHYLRLGLTEGGCLIPVTLATVGYSAPASWNGWIAVADPAVIAFLQAVTLIVAVWLSVFLTQKIAKQPIRYLLPQHCATVAIGSLFWKIIVGW